MCKEVFTVIFLLKFACISSKDAELPLCPTNVLYFPQNLPMHCRMPTKADFSGLPGSPTIVPQLHPNSPDKRPALSVPIPIPGPMPGPIPMPGSIPMPGPIPLPGSIPLPGPMPLPGSMAMPGPIAIPGPMPVPAPPGMPFPGPMPRAPGPSHKLPVIVMPFYSPDPSYKQDQRPNHPQLPNRQKKWKIRHRRRRPHFLPRDTSSNTDTDTSSESSSSSSEYQGWWKGRRNHRRMFGPMRTKNKKRHHKRQLLTPVLQYVTKDGYVIFEKKISKNEAKDWLNVKQDERAKASTRTAPEGADLETNEQIDNNHTGERERITEDNVEVITKKNVHKLSRIKANKNDAAKKKILGRPL